MLTAPRWHCPGLKSRPAKAQHKLWPLQKTKYEGCSFQRSLGSIPCIATVGVNLRQRRSLLCNLVANHADGLHLVRIMCAKCVQLQKVAVTSRPGKASCGALERLHGGLHCSVISYRSPLLLPVSWHADCTHIMRQSVYSCTSQHAHHDDAQGGLHVLTLLRVQTFIVSGTAPSSAISLQMSSLAAIFLAAPHTAAMVAGSVTFCCFKMESNSRGAPCCARVLLFWKALHAAQLVGAHCHWKGRRKVVLGFGFCHCCCCFLFQARESQQRCTMQS